MSQSPYMLTSGNTSNVKMIESGLYAERRISNRTKAKKAAGIEIKFKNPKRKSDADLRPTDGKKTKWTNSSKVFRMLQDEAETGVLTAKAKAKEKKNLIMEKRRAKSFKL